jgi:hypothetical protein
VRGATFDCGWAVVVGAALVAVDAVLDVLLLLGAEPELHPTKPIPKAAITTAAPLTAAVRLINNSCRSASTARTKSLVTVRER